MCDATCFSGGIVMGWAKFFRWLADIIDHRQEPEEPELPFELPELPPGATGIIDEINHAEVIGQPATRFSRGVQVYTDSTGRKYRRTFKNNVHVSGCGHNVSKTEDIAFTSYISGKPVCKTCEREYRRMRNDTRHEDCVCRHLVAPFELKRVDGKGFVCKKCKKKMDRRKPLKAIGWLLGLFLKPLIIEEPSQKSEEPHETFISLPERGLPPPVPYDSPTWTRYRPPHQTPHEMGRGRSPGSNRYP